MNRFINAVVLFFTLITAFIAIYVGFDLPVKMLRTTGAHIPYIDEVMSGLGVIIFVIVLRRTYRRWMALRIVGKPQKFKWNQIVSTRRKGRVITYNLIEVAVYTFGSLGLYFLTDRAWVPAAALLFAAIDSLALSFVSGKYRVGLSSKALIVADREVVVLYFTGLRKVSIHQQTIYFDYIKDLQLSFPLNCIASEEQEHFFSLLKAQLPEDKVYFSLKKG